jgi:transcriptional regulator with XRE-family HTH domain
MDLENFYKKLGTRIKYLREKANLTQEKLAEKADISLDFMGKIEVNLNKPGLRSLIKLADALNLKVKDFFDFD